MPIYVLQRRLGKGGFGQVWLGQRLIHRKCTSANKPYQVGRQQGLVLIRGHLLERCLHALRCAESPSAAGPSCTDHQFAQITLQHPMQELCGAVKYSGCIASQQGGHEAARKHVSRQRKHGTDSLVQLVPCAQVAIKFEACTSKGLSRNGTPHEWAVYAKLGALYGVPRIFARGRCLGDYFTMVRPFCFLTHPSGVLTHPSWGPSPATSPLAARLHASMQRLCRPPQVRQHLVCLNADDVLVLFNTRLCSTCSTAACRRQSAVSHACRRWSCWVREPVGRVERARGAGGMPVPFVACVAVEALRILQGLHQKGVRDGLFLLPLLIQGFLPPAPLMELASASVR